MRTIFLRLVTTALSASLAIALLLGLFAWLALHIDWRVPDAAQLASPSVLLDRDGDVIARFTSEQDRRVVSLDQVSAAARDAIVAAEDVRFYEHTGVDAVALVRAVARNLVTGSIEQGGSTLTQQYVRNGLEGIGTERSFVRKIREAVVSIQLERKLVEETGSLRAAKDRVLEDYLNTVYFGEGAYGIEAAALTFFDRHARDLTAAQGAALAQALPAPSARNARVDPDGARVRRDRVLTTMELAGLLTPAAADAARAEPMDVHPRQPVTYEFPYFTEYVRKQLVTAYGQQRVLTGGLEVRTTLDVDVHRALREAVAEQLPPQEGENADVDAGVVAVDPRTGDILGLYGGRDFVEDQLDLATQGRRQNGSTFKPVAFVAALEDGMSPRQRYRSPGFIRIPAARCEQYEGPAIEVRGGPGGSLRLQDALTRSVNTVFAQVGCELGAPRVIEVARRMGIRNEIPPFPAVALGGSTYGASVLDMTSAFATLANDGRYCWARSILEVRDPAGAALEPPDEVTVVPGMPTRTRRLPSAELEGRPERVAELDDERCVGAVDPDVARTTTQALERVVAETTGRRADIGRPQAGKTGTANDEREAWFVGYTPDVAIGVWVGHRESNATLRDIAGFSRVQGGTIPALIWKAAAERILAAVPANDFLAPGEDVDARRVAPAPARPRTDPSPEPGASPQPTPDPGTGTGGEGNGPPDDGGSPDPGEPSPSPTDGDDGCDLVLIDPDCHGP